MRITNHNNLPEEIVRAIKNDPYDRGDSDITVTELVSPPRMTALKREFHSEIEEDASDRIFSLMGQAMHHILERAGKDQEGVEVEKRLYAQVEGWKVGGAFDSLRTTKGVMSDFKMTSVWAVIDGPKPEWVEQLNFLRVLANENGYDSIEKLQIIAILRDWSKTKAKFDKNYPSTQVIAIDVPVWDYETAKTELRNKVLSHKKAMETLPTCTKEEMWAKDTVWAVMAKGRKRALKLHTSATEAYQHANRTAGAYVEERKGESTRCEYYCPVAEFCSQYQEELK